MQMHHGKNKDAISVLGIDNAIWKTPDLATTDVISKSHPGFRKTENILDCEVDLDDEIITETRLTIFIIIHGMKELHLSLWMK